MTTCNNFDSYNGWIMPGSCRQVGFGPQDYFMDENGDIWVPCRCPATAEGGSAQAAEIAAAVLSYTHVPGAFVHIPVPESVAHPQVFYREAHSGMVRLYVTREHPAAHSLAPRCAVCFQNDFRRSASVAVKRLGVSVGDEPGEAAERFFLSQPLAATQVNPGGCVWLDLTGGPAEEAFEALLELEITGEVSVSCCAVFDGLDAARKPLRARPSGVFMTPTSLGEISARLAWRVDDRSENGPLPVELRGAKRERWVTHMPQACAAEIDGKQYAAVFADMLKSEEGCNRGVVYHERVALENTGGRARRLRYYFTSVCGGDTHVLLYIPELSDYVRRIVIPKRGEGDDRREFAFGLKVAGGTAQALDVYYVCGKSALGHLAVLEEG